MQMYSTSWGSQTGETHGKHGSTKLLSVKLEKHWESADLCQAAISPHTLTYTCMFHNIVVPWPLNLVYSSINFGRLKVKVFPESENHQHSICHHSLKFTLKSVHNFLNYFAKTRPTNIQIQAVT